MRALDEPIPQEEALYRWVSVDDVNGEEVLPHAIDLARTSMNREKYWPAPPLTAPHKPERNGLAITRGAILPTNIDINGVAYEFFTVDRPEPDNDAHAEIRSGRLPSPDRPRDDRPEGNKPGSRGGKAKLRAALAGVMHVARSPAPVA